MNLRELAEINGISLSTAKRYKKDGVDLTDLQAVNAHKHAQRTRFNLSKPVHRAKGMQKAAVSDRIAELEWAIWDIHFAAVSIKNKHPELEAELESVFEVTRPVIEKLSEDL